MHDEKEGARVSVRGEEQNAQNAIAPYYQDDAVTIYHGDAQTLLPDLAANLIATDPPYGVGVDYGPMSDDSRPDYWPWMRDMVTLMRCAATTTAFTHRVAALHELSEWDWVGVWFKHWSSGTRLGNSVVLPHWEPVFLYGIHGAGVKTGDHTSDVWEVNPVPAPKGVTRGKDGWASTSVGLAHPTPKPVELYRAFIGAFSAPGDVVLDPFVGSGTTLRAAKDMGRRCIGIDREERWCEVAARRCSQEVLAL